MGAIPWAPQLQNGDVAAKTLMVDFDGLGHYLQPAAAASLRAFADEFESVFGVAFTISEAFRDLPTQYFFYDLYIDGDGNMAAVPGTSSHGQGLAVDINSWVYGNGDTDRHRWLVANAPRFGWSWELVGKPSGERWHFNYVGSWTAAVFTPDKTPYELELEYLVTVADDIVADIKGDLKATLAAMETRIVDNVNTHIAMFAAQTIDKLDGTTLRSDPEQVYTTTKGAQVRGTGAILFIPEVGGKGISFPDPGLFYLYANRGMIDPDVQNVPINEYNAYARANGLTEDPGTPA
jgi:hypothetical protein